MVALLFTPSVFAASSVELAVRGKITPSACTPAFAGSNIIEHGKIAAKDLVQNNPTPLPVATVKLSITCEASTFFAIKPIDNRSGTSTSPFNFGLGFVNGDKKLGSFNLTPKNMLADGIGVQPIASMDGGKTWYAEWGWELWTLWGAGAMDDASTPLPSKVLEMDIEVGTTIARADRFDLSEEVAIDGSGTLEVVYL
ncbi:DUF1120 domain-containing protein [Pseudomonas sp. WS 5086]|nr:MULTISPECIES: DUF1120 domain-containing protein [unclassified Pseudomonas]NMX91713.1 DUF1120 domain-containing protein [Pseudomonas sp. WS 5086]NMY46328.1 DUF1120 domain-containing protein [Pseudomonas sp. WS 5027]